MYCVVLSCVVLCRIVVYCTVWHIVRGNLRAPQFLKIERYAQRLSHRVCMGDGGSGWWAPASVLRNFVHHCSSVPRSFIHCRAKPTFDVALWRIDFIRWRTGRWQTDTLAKWPVFDCSLAFFFAFSQSRVVTHPILTMVSRGKIAWQSPICIHICHHSYETNWHVHRSSFHTFS